MKKLASTLSLFISLVHFSFSQNTFPATGNVGIGTMSAAKLLSLFNVTDPSIKQATTNYVYLTGPSADDGIYHIARADGVSADRLTILANGNVGIGITTPSNRFHIQGNIGGNSIMQLYSTDATDGRTTIQFGSAKGSQNWEFGENVAGGTGIFGLRDLTTSGFPIRFIVNTSGNFGIGTITPLTNFHIAGPNSYTSLYLENDNAGTPSANAIFEMAYGASTMQFESRNSTGGNPIGLYQLSISTTGAVSHNWYIAGVSKMFLNNNGNLGIGTTTPNGKVVAVGVSELTTDANSGLGLLRISSGTGASTDESLVFGVHDTDFSWVQAVKAGTANRNLVLEPNGGNVGVGTTNTQGYKFAVNGTAIATAMTVKAFANWPDYVLKKGYQLTPLNDLKTYIDKNHHLPEMPSEMEVAKDGINLGEMNKLLTKKVEELTLYLLANNELLKKEQAKNNQQEYKLIEQQNQLEQLKKQIELIAKQTTQKEIK